MNAERFSPNNMTSGVGFLTETTLKVSDAVFSFMFQILIISQCSPSMPAAGT